MAHFSNGTEGEFYQGEYCDNCRQFKQRSEPNTYSSCPIWDLHLLHMQDADMEHVLDLLIPRKDGHNQECTMLDRKEDEYETAMVKLRDETRDERNSV